MKKLFNYCLLAGGATLLPQVSYGYHGDYGYNRDVQILSFLISLGALVLFIILIVKFVTMANNVKALRDKIVGYGSLPVQQDSLMDIDAEYRAIIVGEGLDEAKKHLKKRILSDMTSLLSNTAKKCYTKDAVMRNLENKYGNYINISGLSKEKMEDVLSERFPEELDGIKVGDEVLLRYYSSSYNTVLGIDAVAKIYYIPVSGYTRAFTRADIQDPM